MLDKIKFAIQKFMYGRNGGDALGWVALVAGAVCSLLSGILEMKLFSLLALVCLAYSLFRMYSRNVSQRKTENAKFLAWFRLKKQQLTDRDHRYYRCPQCRQTVRVPKGKGKINIRCPQCQHQFEKKT